MSKTPELRELEFVVGNALTLQPHSYHQAAKETDFTNKLPLRDRIITVYDEPYKQNQELNRIGQLLPSKNQTLLAIDAKWRRIEQRCMCIFILICLFAAICSVITIIFLGRGGRFNTDYHKYKDLPATTCLGGANITDIWYSPPYPFNTTPTYTPAWATYQTYGYLANGSLVPVLGQIPNRLEQMGYVDIPCGNCDGPQPRCSYKSCSCQCQYRLGDLQIVIAGLLSKNNFTCVIDTTGTIFSLVPSADKLNYMYRNQRSGIITLAVGASLVVLFAIISYWRMCVIRE
jgi:hypothetical protein